MQLKLEIEKKKANFLQWVIGAPSKYPYPFSEKTIFTNCTCCLSKSFLHMKAYTHNTYMHFFFFYLNQMVAYFVF